MATVHDAAPFLHPATFAPGQGPLLRRGVRSSIRRAARVIVPSEAVARELLAVTDLSPDRVRVVPHGVTTTRPVGRERVEEIRSDLRLPDRVVLTVGTLQPRKGVGSIVRAFRALPDRHREGLGLVIAGRRGWRTRDLERVIAEAGPSVRYLGEVGEEVLAALHRLAEVFVSASAYEGYGLAALEAAAAGVPLVTTPLPWLDPDQALVVEPGDEAALVIALDRLLSDPALRERLARRGREGAASRSWDEAARETAAVYREAWSDARGSAGR